MRVGAAHIGGRLAVIAIEVGRADKNASVILCVVLAARCVAERGIGAVTRVNQRGAQVEQALVPAQHGCRRPTRQAKAAVGVSIGTADVDDPCLGRDAGRVLGHAEEWRKGRRGG